VKNGSVIFRRVFQKKLDEFIAINFGSLIWQFFVEGG